MRRFSVPTVTTAAAGVLFLGQSTTPGATSNVSLLMAIQHSLRFNSTLTKETRDALTKALSRVKEEARGQLIDLTDMNEASRNASNALQESLKRNPIEDPKLKGKVATLTASLKAYNTRLSNLSNEARSMQTEVESALKLIWGGKAPGQQSSEETTTTKKENASNTDFEVDVPPLAQKIEKVLGSEDNTTDSSASTKTSTADTSSSGPLEGDFIHEDLTAPKKKTETSTKKEEEELEIELDPAEVKEESPADKLSISEITAELHDKDIDFTDCRDADSLRKRYKEYLDGKVKSRFAKTNNDNSAKKPQEQQRQTQQPPTPQQPRSSTQYSQPSYNSSSSSANSNYQNPTPNTTETGIANDPYPNATRKMVDPMQYVSQVKLDIAKEKGVDPNTIDLWSGYIKLEDHKRLYDYPTIQQYPIEVRHKGDTPRGA